LRHPFDFTKVAFYDVQKAENEFAGLFDHLKHRFIDFSNVAFCDIQKADYEFSEPT
jgi:hypothetical protein